MAKRPSISEARDYSIPVSAISQFTYDTLRTHNEKLTSENEKLSREAHTANQSLKSTQAEMHRLEIEVWEFFILLMGNNHVQVAELQQENVSLRESLAADLERAR